MSALGERSAETSAGLVGRRSGRLVEGAVSSDVSRRVYDTEISNVGTASSDGRPPAERAERSVAPSSAARDGADPTAGFAFVGATSPADSDGRRALRTAPPAHRRELRREAPGKPLGLEPAPTRRSEAARTWTEAPLGAAASQR